MITLSRPWITSSIILTTISLLSTGNDGTVSGFTTPTTIHEHPLCHGHRQKPNSSKCTQQRRRPFEHHHRPLQPPPPPSSLAMGYNLPPGGGGGPFAAISELLPSILTIGAIFLFLSSPLGSLFFAVTNSIILLVFLTPVLLYVGFNVWTKLYTVQDECPNPSCSSPVQVLKDESAGPSVCLGCGCYVRATKGGDGVEMCNDPSDVLNENDAGSVFDALFGGGGGMGGGGSRGGGGGTFVSDGDAEVYVSDKGASSSSTSTSTPKEGVNSSRGAIIDVDVEKE